jgi:hypothetical protein
MRENHPLVQEFARAEDIVILEITKQYHSIQDSSPHNSETSLSMLYPRVHPRSKHQNSKNSLSMPLPQLPLLIPIPCPPTPIPLTCQFENKDS